MMFCLSQSLFTEDFEISEMLKNNLHSLEMAITSGRLQRQQK